MRHGRKTIKLQRRADHRNALLANLVCSLIEHKQIKTTVAKAKAVRPFADRMVTLGKRGDLHARRTAIGYLHSKDTVKELFDKVAPAANHRQGGYTRIIKLGQRPTDSAPMAFIEWVDNAGAASEEVVTAAAAEPVKTKTEKAKAEAVEGETA
ncbi:MAG: 50S ribosomal protein L17 [Verrucomicrobiota bacterium]